MKQLIKRIIFRYQFWRAVKKADRFRRITHRKYMVLVVNRKLQVIAKQDVRKHIAAGTFRKGTTVQDIEQKALYITL